MKLFFKKLGTGTPLVLLHGLFGSSDNMLRIGRHFEDRFEVYIPDLRNHGHSPHHDVMNYKALSCDLAAFFEDNNILSAIVLGHSMGGKAAMQFATDHAEKVDKLIIADIGIKKYPSTIFQHINTIRNFDFKSMSSRRDAEKKLTQQIQNRDIAGLLLTNIIWKNKKLCWQFNADALCSNIDNIIDVINPENIYNKPSLFIRGALSDYIIDTDLNDIRKLFPMMQLETVPEAGHWVHVDNPDYFIYSVEKFLENI